MQTNFLKFLLVIALTQTTSAFSDPLICSGAFDQFGSRDWSQRIAKYRAAHPRVSDKTRAPSKINQAEESQKNKNETKAENSEEPDQELPKEDL